MMLNTTTDLMQPPRVECHIGGEGLAVPSQGGDGRWSGQLEHLPGALEWRREPRVFRVGLTLTPDGDDV
jgi:hypothetical protein